MRFCSVSSGSNGNCSFVETNERRILIDAGLSAKAIEGLLREKEIDPATISAIFVTHEHTDHTCGVGVWARRYKIPVMATAGTWKGMEKTVGCIPGELRVEIEAGRGYRMGDLRILAIPTSHDANDPCAYTVESGGRKVSVITDTGYLTQLMVDHLKDSDLAVVESNHDIEMLLNGPYSYALKKRIRGSKGHLSNNDCGDVLAEVRRSNQGGVFLLGHLSEENNRPELAMRTVGDIIRQNGMNVGEVEVTVRGGSTDLFLI